MNDRTVAIVVTYNRRDYMLRCVDALLQQTMPTDILIIDNASTDDTADAVAAMSDARIHYHCMHKNLGGAGGFQRGMREAVAMGYDYLWVMDDDCVPDPTALETLWQAHLSLDGQYGFLSSIAYWRDGKPCLMNIQHTGLCGRLRHIDTPIAPVRMASFVSAFFPAARVREVGLPIKEFFIWADDLEYTRRLSRRYPCYAVRDSRVLHDMLTDGRVNIATDTAQRLPRYRLLYRNETYVYRREGLRGWLYLYARAALHVLRALGAKSDRAKRVGVILSSLAAGLTFRPAIEYVEEVEG